MKTAVLYSAVVAVLATAASAGIVVPRQASSAASVANSAPASAASTIADSASSGPSSAAQTASSAASSSTDSSLTSSPTAAANSASASSTANATTPLVSASAPPTSSSVAVLPPYGAQNLSSLANSSVAGPQGLNNSVCRNITLQVPVQAENVNYTNVDLNYSNQSYITGQILEFANFQQPWIASRESGKQPNNRTYSIHSTYCTPRQGGAPNASLIVAVHGIGYNSAYWDFRPNGSDEYSFIQQATSSGYSVLTYDRLGTGQSDHPADGFSEVQAATEVSILANILGQLRNGTVVQGRQFEKIVGVGHSYGSVQLSALTAISPELLQGVALTGFSTDTAGVSSFLLAGNLAPANQVFPQRFNNISDVYLVTGSPAADITLFLWPPNFSPDAAQIARDQYDDAVTLGTLTSQSTVQQPSANFTGDVFVIAGEHDLPFCSGNCTAPLLDSVKDKLYPKAGNFSSYIVPETGHGLVVHYTGPESNRRVVQFFEDNQL